MLYVSGFGYAQGMRVHVDQEKCQGHNRCVVIAPELFEADDLGVASAKGNGDVPSGQEENARLAVDNCPEFAVTITDD